MIPTSASPSHRPGAATQRAGQILAGLVLAGIVVALAVFSLAIAGVLAVALAVGLAWQSGRGLIWNKVDPEQRQNRSRFETYQQTRLAALARQQAAFDAHVAQQRMAANAARFEAFRAQTGKG
jgi:hypothetical protein